ncbi:MAG: DUF2461 domain-containing protein [Clostridium sp.]|jgi:uncharacterized protein (TIGR02453 family)|nr:DUF2461 domain-containing protein [Clostridium sp.]
MGYSGITADAMLLLAENRLRDSRDYYEEHKAQINAQVIEPMRQLAQTAGELMLEHDPLVQVMPTRMVSRVRRDTRFTKDKSLYRDHVWLTVGRGKKEWPLHPCFWFEVYPGGYGAGVGYWYQPPLFAEHWRAWLIENAGSAIPAIAAAEKAGFLLTGEEYKKPKPGEAPPELLRFMLKKEIYFLRTKTDFPALAKQTFPKRLCDDYIKLLPLYDCLTAISDSYIAQNPGAVESLLSSMRNRG